MQNMDIATPTKKYHHGKTTVYSCQYHIIFCPKYRRKVLTGGIDEDLKQLILDKQEDYGYSVIEMEVMPDHVHLLLDIDPTREALTVTIHKLKGYTAHELRAKHPQLKTKLPCLWTRSTFVSTVGAVSLETVKKYIDDQKNV